MKTSGHVFVKTEAKSRKINSLFCRKNSIKSRNVIDYMITNEKGA